MAWSEVALARGVGSVETRVCGVERGGLETAAAHGHVLSLDIFLYGRTDQFPSLE
jgi:hypothetical protein